MTDNIKTDDPSTDTGLPIITFENEDGETIEFAQLVVFEIEDITYAALAPMVQLDRGEVELYLFRTGEEDGDRFYNPVEDDALAQRAFDVAVKLLDGTDGDQ